MKIICHRGYWKKKHQQNSLPAISSSFPFDGVEIDLRSMQATIVLSHDPLLGKNFDSLDEAFNLNAPANFFWALNIKEDGLGPELARLIRKHAIKNYMCFDLSYPQSVVYRKLGLRVFERFSDQEKQLPKPPWLVMDCFKSSNFNKVLSECEGKKLFVISPELHGQNHLPAWNRIKKLNIKNWLCTDYPTEARKFFS
jgi:hypothetical protein